MVSFVKAEDVLQVIPFTTTSGVVEDDWECFSVEMVNTQSYTALQFDLYLPEGMTLISDGPMELSADRFPGYTRKGVFIPEHTYECTKMNDGHYFITIYHTDFAPIKGNDGELLTFYYETADDMPAGYYPIKVTGTVLAVDSHTDTKPEASMSYVKVGEPSPNAILDFGDYFIPSFVESALPAQNVIKNGVCPNLVLTDGYDFTPTGEFTAITASYSRAMSNDWGTVCLPFALTSDATVQYYKLSSVNNETMKFEPVATVEAGEPAVFKKISASALSVNAQNVTITAGDKEKAQDVSGWTMKGTYVAVNKNSDANNDIYYIAQDKFWYANQTFPVDAFRGWFETTKPSEAGTRVHMFIISEENGTITSVNYIENEDRTVDIRFDLTGKMLSAPKNGINIINGKKVLVK